MSRLYRKIAILNPVLRVNKLSKRFGSRLVFRELDFEIERGSVAAVVGSNGAGKSTLLRIIAGLMRASAGEVLWENGDFRCGLFAPDAPVYRELTVAENLEFFSSTLERGSTLPAVQLERFQLFERRSQFAGDLSSGWRARLQLAIATLGAPAVLLLDEPSAHLDENGLQLLHRVLEAQRAHGFALVATNDAREVARCDFAIAL